MRSVVVLPAPFGPRRPKQAPLGTSRLTRSTAVRAPKCFDTSRRAATISGTERELRSAADRGLGLGDAAPHREDAVSAQDSAAPEQAPSLPVREPELGLLEGVLAVDPAREAVAD